MDERTSDCTEPTVGYCCFKHKIEDIRAKGPAGTLRVPLTFKQPWTVREYQKEIFEGAKADGRDIQRKGVSYT